jgi:Kelch motif protein
MVDLDIPSKGIIGGIMRTKPDRRCLLGCALLAGLLAPPGHADPAGGALALEDRVRFQRAIEEVYWRHRIWPRENPTPKPALSSVMTEAAIRGKVDDYLRQSSALETLWNDSVTAEQLQAELDRIVRDTRDSSTLAEVFHALGDDPYVIAETFVRHTLVDRLVRDRYASDARFHGALKARAEAARQACTSVACMKSMGGDYHETTFTRATGDGLALDRVVGLEPKEWVTERARVRGPVGRLGDVEETRDAFRVTALLADGPERFTSASVSWPKISFDTWWADRRASFSPSPQPMAASYSIRSIDLVGCTPDTWASTYAGAPDPRYGHTAVWTGTEMIVWGTNDLYSTGGRYNPATDTWTETSHGANVPSPRYDHAAVWTGTEMIVWGGTNDSSVLNDGARYNPASDTWAATTGRSISIPAAATIPRPTPGQRHRSGQAPPRPVRARPPCGPAPR